MRIDKLLSNMGYGTRKEVHQLLKKGVVNINDEVVKKSGMHVDINTDQVTILGEVVEYRKFVYLMMNKPQGVISATEDSRDQTVIDLLSADYQHYEPFPVGRLDKDTEGFLILTNDGKLTHNLLSPKKGVPKTYYAHISGVVTEADTEAFERGVTLEDGYETQPGKLHIIKSDDISEIELTITEGKFHQVKRMFAAVEKKVIYLKRLSMGPLKLDESLELGSYRELTEEEIKTLKEVGK